jgi:8-oxo-dGTP diphosphatase
MIMYDNGYVPPILTVDIIIFSLIENKLTVLLIKRTQDPFKGVCAIPGGYNAAGETTIEAATRVLQVKAGISLKDLGFVDQLRTFDTVARDPRGHAVSVVYMGLSSRLAPVMSENTQHPQFLPIKKLPATAYDHKDIIAYARKRLASQITHSNVIYALLPRNFTLTQLQNAYEAILGKPLDKRNFRKKFLSLGFISPTAEYFREGAHRPALLYKFNKQSLEYFSRNFVD